MDRRSDSRLSEKKPRYFFAPDVSGAATGSGSDASRGMVNPSLVDIEELLEWPPRIEFRSDRSGGSNRSRIRRLPRVRMAASEALSREPASRGSETALERSPQTAAKADAEGQVKRPAMDCAAGDVEFPTLDVVREAAWPDGSAYLPARDGPSAKAEATFA